MNEMINKVNVDGKDYAVEAMSDQGKKLTDLLQAVDARVKEKSDLIAVLTKAKKAYIADLKSEMLSKKAGFDFSD